MYNDFYVGEDADVTIVAGCGVHTENGEHARHNGIHRFFLEKGARVQYMEKHVGTGKGAGIRLHRPGDRVRAGKEDAVLEMDTSQIGGVDRTTRKTTRHPGRRAPSWSSGSACSPRASSRRYTDFEVTMNGEGASTDLMSRSVAKGTPTRRTGAKSRGNAACAGHSECDAIIADHGRVDAAPELSANHGDAALIHEAAIGKIAGEQIMKLRTLGLTEEEAEEKIVEGFLS